MKISHLSETNSTPTSGPDQMAGSQAPKMGRSNKFLEEKEEETVEECTTSGSVASASAPIGGMNRRGKGSMLKGINTSSKYANSAAVKEGRDAYQRDYDSSRTGFGRPPREDDEYHNGGDEDIAYTMYLYNTERDRLVQKKIKGYYYDSAKAEGWRPNQIDALKVHGIIRSKFDPNQWVKKEGTRWLKVYPFGKPEDTPDQQMKEATTTQMPFGSITTPDPSPEQQAAYAAQQQQHARFDPRWRLRPEGKEWLLMARQELEAAAQESDHDFKEVGVALSHDQVEKFGKNDKTFAYGNRFHADLTTDILKLMNQISPPQGGYSADDEAVADLSDKYSVASEREKQQLYKMTAKQNNMSTAEAKEYIEDCIAQRTMIDPEQWKEWHRDEEVTENAGTPPSFYTKCKTCGTPYNEHFRFDENGKILSSLVRHPTMKDDFPGMDGMSLKSTSSVPQQSVMPSGTTTQPSLSVDSKGRTQKQWMQAVKSKFPDAQIIQAKMMGGPVIARLADGRQLIWNKVDQPVAEVAPPGAKAERMVKHIKAGYSKDGKLTPKEKSIAYATAWKAHNRGKVEEQGVAEGIDIGKEWMSDTELDQYVPNHLQQKWRELLGYDINGNPSALWANLTGGYEPDVNDPQHRALMVKVANKWFAAKKIPNVKFFDVKDADDELEWLVQIGQQGVAEGKDDKIAQLKKDHDTAVHWSKNETSPQKREAARQKAEKIKAHLEKQYKQGVAEGSLNEGQYEMMMRNGQVKKFIAKDDADAKRIAAGHGAKSVIKLRGGVPAGKVAEQGVAEEKQRLDPKCWTGYKKQGTKMKGGTRVNNCVPIDEAEVSEDKLAGDLYKDFQIFKKGADKGIGSKAKDREIGNKPQDKGIIAKEGFNGEYDDEAGSAESNLLTTARAVKGLIDTIGERDNLPEWVQEKIAKAEGMLVTAWDYLQSQEEQGIDPQVDEDWQKVNKHDKTDGMSSKAVKAYRRENPGSKLKTAVTKKPSELKAGSKDANRRKSFCARMSGVKGPMKDEHGKPTAKAKALNRWNC
jgi:hypothetical protein